MKALGYFLLYFILPVILIGSFFWYGWGQDLVKPHDLAVKGLLTGDFGQVVGAQSVEEIVTIVNNGKSDATISRIYSDCDCLLVLVPVGKDVYGPLGLPKTENEEPLGIILPSGNEMQMRVEFSPWGLSRNDFKGNIYVETSKSGQILEIPIKAQLI